MPVQFKVAPHGANIINAQQFATPLQLIYSNPHSPMPRVLQSTFGGRDQGLTSNESQQSRLLGTEGRDSSNLLPNLIKRKNGFVDTIVSAYSNHQHLVLRPDDVWIAILSHLNIYVNHHAEELRSHFVAHEGQKELSITMDYPIDFAVFAERMAGELAKNITDEELKDWVLPDFTTTTSNDKIVSAIMMMSTLKAYFKYAGIQMTCGLPSVTLAGEREDWEKLVARIDKLKSFGPEPTHWTTLLLPILSRFVQAFDGNPDVEFWNHVYSVRYMGSGMDYITGWLTAFCVWDVKGRWRGIPQQHHIQSGLVYSLEGASYPVISLGAITPGHCEVGVTVWEGGVSLPPQKCQMIAGNLASLVDDANRDTLSPLPAWFILQEPDDS